MKKIEWFRRKFGQHNDNGTLPGIVERLAGTPARLEEKIRDMLPDLIEQHFPKGKCKERGQAMVLCSLFLIEMSKAIKAELGECNGE